MPLWHGLRGRRWRLRTGLLVSILALVVVAAVVIGQLQSALTARRLDALVELEASRVLNGLDANLSERRQAAEASAQVLAGSPGLSDSVAAGDRAELIVQLYPLQTGLHLRRVSVYDTAGRELLWLGDPRKEPVLAELVEAGRNGMVASATSFAPDGLFITAAAPVHMPSIDSGVVTVMTWLDLNLLDDLVEPSGAELAVYQNGRLAGTTMHDPTVADYLSTVDLSGGDARTLNRGLRPFGYQARLRPQGSNGAVVLLVSTADLMQVVTDQRLVDLAGMIALAVGLVLGMLHFSRRILRPLESMVAAAHDMEAGNYSRRVEGGQVQELAELAGAMNHLAAKVERQLAELSNQAFYDRLTGLPNRTLFVQRLDDGLKRANQAVRPLAVMFLDLDNFKVVNDSLGHQMGDRLLVAVADRLRECTGSGCTVGRMSGDEFTVLIDEMADSGEAIRRADQIVAAFQAPIDLGEREVYVSSSIGIVIATGQYRSSQEMLRDADVAMYQAKYGGKARYAVYDQSLSMQAARRLELETGLRRAIERAEFRLHYQPIVCIDTGAVREVEALIRWLDPQRGMVSPGEFIPLAEETGLILPIGRWVLEGACRQAAQWRLQLGDKAPPRVSVNLSPLQVQNPALPGEVAEVLRRTGLPPACLKLEITETILMQDVEQTRQTLESLKNLGVSLAIDDFGKGYSSLGYLKQFPVDVIKIDRCFVEPAGRDPGDTAILRAVLALARDLGKQTVAEGVETALQREALRGLGCDWAQGFLFARPMPPDRLESLLASGAVPTAG